ncbi:uncharacterized protein LOC142316921 [Anomaloglossus baeobatrachus]|uniref:uncharacterized protein LOC142316921 n=1 Tax=Anomaloglossus baeobatrachus TaxID=238106 RepID=UPI003F50CA1A
MDKHQNKIAKRILSFTLEIIYLLTGEDYTIVKKMSGDCVTLDSHESGGRSRRRGPITAPPPHILIHERNNKKILELTNKMIELLTGEVPVRCQDVTVYFSMEEWEYLEGHKDLYEDVMMEINQPPTSQDGSRRRNPPEICPHPLYPQDRPEEKHDVPENNQAEDLIDIKVVVIDDEEEEEMEDDQQYGLIERNPPERCPRPLYHQEPPERCPSPLYPQDYLEENHSVPENDQAEDLTIIKVKVEEEEKTRDDQTSEVKEETSVDVIGVLFLNNPRNMDKHQNKIAKRILSFALEIIYLLTGEDYTIVKKTSGDCVTPGSHESGGWSKRRGLLTAPPPHSLIHERNNKKILELTNKMMELLTGEVPVRCQDITVYFSMEEWEYLEGHKDLYEEVMMESDRPPTSQDGSRSGNPPEICPRPLYPQDRPERWPRPLYPQDPPERCPRPLYPQDPPEICPRPLYPQDHPERWPRPLYPQDPPERCPRPLYPQDPPERCPRPLYPQDPPERCPHPLYPQDPPERCPRPLYPQDPPERCPRPLYPQDPPERCPRPLYPQDPPERCPRPLYLQDPPERCPRSLYPQDDPEENHSVPENKAEDLTMIKVKSEEEKTRDDQPCEVKEETSVDVIGVLFLNNPRNMDKHQNKIAKRILSFALEIIYLLTGEDYTIVKKTSGDCATPDNHESGGRSKRRGPITEPPPHSLIHERSNKKILELTNKMIELLTGEVPVRCQDVTVYFSMEEWDYLEGHKDLYEEVMIENDRPPTSQDGSRSGNPPERCPCPLYPQDRPERCPHPLYPQDCPEENHDVPETHQAEDLIDIKVVVIDDKEKEEAMEDDQQYGFIERNPPERCPRLLYPQDDPEENHSVPENDQAEDLTMIKVKSEEEKTRDDQPCEVKEETSVDVIGENPNEQSKGNFMSSLNNKRDENIMHHSSGEKCTTIPPNLHRTDLSYNLPNHEETSPDRSQIKRNHTMEKSLSCSKCGKCFTCNSQLIIHERRHTGEKPYACLICGKCFTDKPHLASHKRSHTGEKPYSCSECEKFFSTKAILANHQKIHTGEKPYACSECGKCFITKTHLARHEKIHTGERPYSCSLCGKCFTEKANLISHGRIHTGEKPYSCPECGKCFTDKASIVAHERGHTGEKPYPCLVCGKCFIHKSNLARHERVHTGEKPYSCSLCGKCFTGKPNLIIHERIHRGEKPYPCPQCGKCFTDKSSLVNHQKIHTGEKPYSCSDCGKSFRNKSHLVRHERIHTGERPYSCSVCGKCFTEKANLVTHERIHTGEKPFSCPECGKSFTDRSSLVTHQKIHKGVKPFPCGVCGKCFIYKSNLVRHERTHTGEKPYSCSLCGKCFTGKTNLVIHDRIHRGEKPYPCPVCGRRFTDKSSLFIHERIHTGEKPYSCSHCGKCFPKKSHLVKHQRIHTGEKPYSCSECGKCFTGRPNLVIHERIHRGERPYSCSVCKKCFTDKSSLVKHEKSHTGEKPL